MLHPLLDRATSTRRAATARAAAASDLAPRLARTADLAAHTGCVNTVAWIDGGDRLVTGSDDRTVAVWRVGGGAGAAVEWRAQTAHRANVFQARFLGASELATCSADGQVHLSPLGAAGPPGGGARGGDGAPPPHRLLFAHAGRAHKMALAPDSPPTTLYTVGEDGQFAMVDVRAAPGSPAAGVAFAGRSRGGRVPVALFAVAVDPTRPHLVAVGGEACLGRVLDVRALAAGGAGAARGGATAAAFLPEHLARAGRRAASLAVTGLAYDCAGRLLASYNGDAAYLFPAGAAARGAGGPAPGASRAMPPDENSSDDGDECGPGSPAASGVPFDARAPGDDAAPGPDGLRRFCGAINVRTVKGAAFLDAHGDHVACGSDDGKFYVWATATSRLRAARGADADVVNIVAPHPAAPMTLATCGIDDTVKLWAPVGERVAAPDGAAAAAAGAMPGGAFGWDDGSDEEGSSTDGSAGEGG